MRLGALLGSVMLIVAVAVFFGLRRADLAHSRDVRLEVAASVAAARLGVVIRTVELAAAVANEPDATVAALTRALDGGRVCVARADGSGTEPTCSYDDPSLTARAAAMLGAGGRSVIGSDDLLEVTVVGEAYGVFAVAGVADGTAIEGVDLSLLRSGDAPAVTAATRDGRRVVAMPIGHGNGLWVSAATDDGIHLATDERPLLVMLSSLAILLLALAGMTIRAERRALVERASVDPLTRLPNRSEFERRAETVLTTADRIQTGVCLLLFDLDGFKAINDTHGHQAGDKVLRVMGDRLCRAVREYDVVARWGGDEFVLMLPGIDDASAARLRAADLAELISREDIDGLHVGASVGIAMYPRHGADLPALIEAADAAMYAAKRDGVTHRLAGVESAPLDPAQPATADRRSAPRVR